MRGPHVTGIGNAAEVHEARALDAEAGTRRWRCSCGAMAISTACVHGHPAPWLNGGKAPAVAPERVRGIVPRVKPTTSEVAVSDGVIKIDKGVPIPPKGRPSHYPWGEMAVGDSFLVPCQDDKAKKVGSSIATSGRHYLRRAGMPEANVTYRAVEGGVRIWRTK